jgi:Gram-negative bacterial TonB protein C-terminal
MTRQFVAALAIVAIGAPAFAQSGKEPLVLKPTSAWHVDYADDRCRLAREFGAGEEQTYLFFDRYGPTEYFRLTLAGKPVKTGADQADASVQFGPAEEEQQLLFLNGNLGKMPALVFVSGARIAALTPAEKQTRDTAKADEEWPDLAPISEDRKKAVRYLKIGKPLRRTVTLETGSMRGPFTALDKCVDELLTHWGIDVEKHKQLTRKVKPVESPGRWVNSADYPLDMLSRGQPAIVEFRLSVNADGKPAACYIQSTTRPKAFDDAVCKSVMRRARFDPALDARGQPLASYYRNTVRFQIPN